MRRFFVFWDTLYKTDNICFNVSSTNLVRFRRKLTMAKKHTCTICLYSSKDQGEVYRCWEQGRKTKRKVGQVVAFCAPLTGKISTGQITEVAFKRRSHEAIFTVKTMNGLVNVSEEDIEAAQTEAA